MAVSDAQKKARDKWDGAHMAVIACKLKKEQAEKFKAYCTKQGITPNSAVKSYILRCIGEQEEQGEQAE